MAELERNIRDHEIDVVWFTNPPGAVVSVPYIATVWDLAHRARPYFPEVSVTGWDWPAREQAYRTVLPRASFVLTGAEAGKTEIVRSYGVDPDNVIVIPLPVPDFDPPTATPAEDTSIRRKYGIHGDFIMYPAQFWPHKNHINLLLALAHLKQHHNLVLHAVFTGSDKGNIAHVQQCIYELGLANEAHILGFVPRADLVALYRSALALVFPSYFGPDNLPPLEAFSLGCPVIASRVHGAEEQLGKGALLFNPSNPADIATQILALRSDQGLRRQLLDNGARIASERTPQAYVARILDLLDGFALMRHCWGRGYRHT